MTMPALGRKLERTRHRYRRGQGEGRRLLSRRAQLGRGAGRHALCQIPDCRASRPISTRSWRIARSSTSCRRSPRASRRISRGTRSAIMPRCARKPRARPWLRCGQFQHLSGSAGAGAQLRHRLARLDARGHAPAGGRAQHRMHRDRPSARQPRPDRLGRRRHQLPRPAGSGPQPRPLSGGCRTGLCRAARWLADAARTQDVRAGLLFHA